MRAVGFRRREGTLDFARRFRFAYSLEHYNKLAGKRRTLEEHLVTLALARRIIAQRKGGTGVPPVDHAPDARATLDSTVGASYDEKPFIKL